MFKSKSLSLSWKRLTESLHDHHHHISIVFAPPPPPPPPPRTHFCCFSTFTRILLFIVSYVLSDKIFPKSNFIGNTDCNIFWCLLCRRNFFFQFLNRVHPCHLYHQNTGNGFNACVSSKKNTKLDHWFWNLFDAKQVRSCSFWRCLHRKKSYTAEGAPYLGSLGACFLKKVLDSVARKCHFLRFRWDILNKRKRRKMQ